MNKPRLDLVKNLWPYLSAAAYFAIVVRLFDKDLGVNLIADVMSVTFGLFVIDKARAGIEARRLEPVHKAALREALEIYNEIRTRMRIIAGVGLRAMHSEQLLGVHDHGLLAHIMGQAPLEGRVPGVGRPIVGGDTWGEVTWVMLRSVDRRIDRFISRYVLLADPELVSVLHRMQESDLLKSAISTPWSPNIPYLSPHSWIMLVDFERDLRIAITQDIEALGLEGSSEFELPEPVVDESLTKEIIAKFGDDHPPLMKVPCSLVTG